MRFVLAFFLRGFSRLRRSAYKGCGRINHSSVDKGAIRINASSFYPYYANRMRYRTVEYKVAKRLRSIWSEGTRASEECLQSALVLNHNKRMATSILLRFNNSILGERCNLQYLRRCLIKGICHILDIGWCSHHTASEGLRAAY